MGQFPGKFAMRHKCDTLFDVTAEDRLRRKFSIGANTMGLLTSDSVSVLSRIRAKMQAPLHRFVSPSLGKKRVVHLKPSRLGIEKQSSTNCPIEERKGSTPPWSTACLIQPMPLQDTRESAIATNCGGNIALNER